MRRHDDHPGWLYLIRERNRHGRPVWFVRKEKGPRIRVKGVLGTPDFRKSYELALRNYDQPQTAKTPVPPPPAPKESLRWLWERYIESAAWKALGTATQRQRLNIMKKVLAQAGDGPYDGIDLIESRDARTSSQGRNFLDAMRGMYRWGAHKDVGLIDHDPSEGIENPSRTETDGFPPWTEEEVEQYEAYYPIGTAERVWIDMLQYTGPRRGDVFKLGKPHVKTVPHPETKIPTRVITFKTEKRRNKKKAPVEVTVPILPVLQRTLDAGPCGELVFIVGKNGRPFKSKESFGNAFSAAARKAGIRKSAHGVRKLAATRAANNLATTHSLMALFGWVTVGMAERYTRTVARAQLGIRSGEKLEKPEELPSHPAPGSRHQKVRGKTGK
jgi:hypothetical protein